MSRQNRPGHHYGLRTVKCQLCQKLFRPEDITGNLCNWCRWDHDPDFRQHLATLPVPDEEVILIHIKAAF